VSEQDERIAEEGGQPAPDETPEGGPPSGPPDSAAHPVEEVPEWR
jgi:hypothetical protein